jgi:hypothetical protein
VGITEFLLLAGAAVVGVLATAVYGMLALPHGYYRAARGCAWAAATVFVALAVLWGFETDAMFLTRAAIVGIVGAIASIALVEALRQIKHIEQHELEKPPLAAKARNPGLFVDCNIVMLPIKAPPDGVYFR